MKTRINGIETNYELHGREGAPWLVLSHSLACSVRMWDPQIAALKDRYRILAYDTRGHGASEAPKGAYTLEMLADDLKALLDHVGAKNPHYCGLSMGGMIGQAFALRHPGRLGKLVIANSTSSYGPEGRKMWEARSRMVEEGGVAAIRDMVASRYFSDDFRASEPGTVERVMQRFAQTPQEGYLGCCDAIAALDYSKDLGRITAPTLVIAGGADAGTPPAMSEALARGIPNAKLAVIPGAAHLSAVEKPAEFNALVREFLASP